jgi:hypothetical protein
MEPIHFTRAQVALMLDVAAVYDPVMDRRLSNAGVESYLNLVQSYLNLKRDGRGGFTWQPR